MCSDESEDVGVMSDSGESDIDKVSIMSDSDSSSDTIQVNLQQKPAKNDHDDLFADIFDNPENVSKLNNILTAKKAEKKKQDLSASAKTNDDDLFSDVFDDSRNVAKLDNILAAKEIPKSGKEKGNDDDLFADIFSDTEDVAKLDDILVPEISTKGKADEISRNKYAEDILSKVTKLDKPTDIFSAISASARGRVESEIETPAKKSSTLVKPVAKALVVPSGGFINNETGIKMGNKTF